MNNTLISAIRLGEKGFCVFPIRKPYRKMMGKYFAKKNGKLPFFFGCSKASSLKDQIQQLFRNVEDSNIGVMTGAAHNLVIIDIDCPSGGETSMKNLDLPDTLTVRTGNGLHLYYCHPGGKIPTCSGKLAPGIDVKGEDSFATAPPSLHYLGNRYQWINENAEMADLPDSTVNKLRKLPHRNKVRNTISMALMTTILLPASALLATLFSTCNE